MLAGLRGRVAIKTFTSRINIINASHKDLDDDSSQKDNSSSELMSKKFRTDINFEIKNDLIYHIDGLNERAKLCILKSLEKNIFRLIHDEHHAGVHRCFQRIKNIIYILRLLRKLRIYIEHCPSCQINQIKRHRSYEELMPISIVPHSFHIIIMDFIIRLSKKYDYLLILIDKFTRRMFLISNYITDFAAI